MARSTSNKIEPAPLRLSFTIGAGLASRNYIDLSQCASLVNRRFYRQGLNWAVGGITVVSGGTASDAALVSVYKLPNTWVMSNSWEKGMRNWMRMTKESLAESSSVRPKFLDYKIYADQFHHQAGFGANLLPYSSEAQFGPGEWEASKYIIPNSAVAGQVFSREAIAVGGNYPGAGASGLNAVSLIEGYAASRGLPNVLDPNAPDDASDADGAVPQNWLTALHNDGTSQDEEVIEDMISDNNIAPYPFENDGVAVDTMYPGGANQGDGMEFVDMAIFTSTTIGAKARLSGSNFPCGLMRIDMGPFEGTSTIFVDLVPGNHRGYLCEPMTEM
jgi:hypothetical protein